MTSRSRYYFSDLEAAKRSEKLFSAALPIVKSICDTVPLSEKIRLLEFFHSPKAKLLREVVLNLHTLYDGDGDSNGPAFRQEQEHEYKFYKAHA